MPTTPTRSTHTLSLLDGEVVEESELGSMRRVTADNLPILNGLSIKRVLLTAYALSGLFAGIAGMLLAGRLASAQPSAATGYELNSIAAVVIGGASLAGGSGKASGTLVGALILAVINNGLNILDVNSFWQQVVMGVVIALAVGIDVIRQRSSRH